MSNELGIDRSGNGNNFTVNNMTVADQVVDSPTNNFCTMNPLEGSANGTYSEGNLRIQTPNYPFGKGTFHVSAGKWYWEWTHHSGTYNTYTGIGNDLRVATAETHNTANTQAWLGNDAALKKWSSTSGYDAGTLAINDIIGIAVDLDNGSIKFYINNTLVGTDNTLPAGTTVTPLLGGSNDGTSGSGWGDITFNFGQDSSFSGFKTAQGNQDGNDIGDFYYTPPTGFLALCSKNLPDVDVTPSEHFNTVLYSGNGADDRAITVGFQPDWTWVKTRSHAQSHRLYDAVRGADRVLVSDTTQAEFSGSADELQSFDTNGFTMDDGFNQSGYNYVAWNWKANGSGSSNTNGSINTTSTSANVDAGFSISTYTGNGTAGATIGHGLSKVPELLIFKRRDGAGNSWDVYHEDMGNTGYLLLDSTNAKATSAWLNNTSPSSSLVTVGNFSDSNASGNTYVMYAFHSVDGYSKVGSYTGNGSDNGTFVYTGFRPAFILIKRTDGAEDWWLQDNKRDIDNPLGKQLYANDDNAEVTEASQDLLSNGFKLRLNNGNWNGSNMSYIYIAFAETPFKYSNAR